MHDNQLWKYRNNESPESNANLLDVTFTISDKGDQEIEVLVENAEIQKVQDQFGRIRVKNNYGRPRKPKSCSVLIIRERAEVKV